jgi:hypothetical protein
MDHLRVLLEVDWKGYHLPRAFDEMTVRPALEIANHQLVTVPDCCKMERNMTVPHSEFTTVRIGATQGLIILIQVLFLGCGVCPMG